MNLAVDQRRKHILRLAEACSEVYSARELRSTKFMLRELDYERPKLGTRGILRVVDLASQWRAAQESQTLPN